MKHGDSPDGHDLVSFKYLYPACGTDTYVLLTLHQTHSHKGVLKTFNITTIISRLPLLLS